MTKIAIVALGLILTAGVSFAGETNPSDQKWLAAVEKKIAAGETEVSTPSKDRADLLKSWASTKGYSVSTKSTDKGFNLKVSRDLAKK